MKKLKIYIAAALLSLSMVSCEIDGFANDAPSLSSVSSTEQNSVLTVSNDNTGNVKIRPEGEGFTKAVVNFGEGSGISGSAVVTAGNSVTHAYPEGSYTVTIVYYDIAGNSYTKEYPLTVTYRAPENVVLNESTEVHNITVSPKADYANGFLVYFDDKDQPVSVANGGTIIYTYEKAGTYTVKLVALSGGAATTTITKEVTVYDAFRLPLTFEDPAQNYSVGGTFGGVGTEIVDNPFKTGMNTSKKVWKYVKGEGAESWSGTWTPFAEPTAEPISMSNGSKITVMVYATETGKYLNMELEQATTGIDNQILKMPVTKANEWQLITFDFGASGAVPDGTKFKQMVLRYDDSSAGSGEVIYIDNITQIK